MRETVIKYAGNRTNSPHYRDYLSNMISGLVFVDSQRGRKKENTL